MNWLKRLIRAYYNYFLFLTRQDGDCENATEEDLRTYIDEAIPELRGQNIPTPRAWSAPDVVLPIPAFLKGDRIVWNDKFIPRAHDARKSCGEGPFTVYVVEDHIVAIPNDDSSPMTADIPKYTRVIIRAPEGNIVIVHPGYFILKNKIR